MAKSTGLKSFLSFFFFFTITSQQSRTVKHNSVENSSPVTRPPSKPKSRASSSSRSIYIFFLFLSLSLSLSFLLSCSYISTLPRRPSPHPLSTSVLYIPRWNTGKKPPLRLFLAKSQLFSPHRPIYFILSRRRFFHFNPTVPYKHCCQPPFVFFFFVSRMGIKFRPTRSIWRED